MFLYICLLILKEILLVRSRKLISEKHKQDSLELPTQFYWVFFNLYIMEQIIYLIGCAFIGFCIGTTLVNYYHTFKNK